MTVDGLLKDYFGLKNKTLIAEVRNALAVYTMEKNEVAVTNGISDSDILFLLSGIVREYYMDTNGKEHTDCLIRSDVNPVVGALPMKRAFKSNKTVLGSYYLQALTPCTIASMSLEHIYEWMSRFPETASIFYNITLDNIRIHYEHTLILMHYSARERYIWMKETYPDLLKQVQKKYVASFLGIAPPTLSAILAEDREQDANSDELLDELG